MDSSTSRLIPIVLALTVLAGTTLLLDYSEQPHSSPPSPVPSPPAAMPPEDAPQVRALPRSQPTARETPPPPLTYKCRTSNGTAYRDHACQPGEQLLATAHQSASADPTVAQAELAQLKARVADMARERQEREAAAAGEALHHRPGTTASNAARCETLWQEIGQIDSLLRQPHSASAGDWWTAQRKEKTDTRFSLGC